ncbi:MAG: hypothetical protein D8M58_06140 [Calditrichaeota bacterium]|nr:MAG: hypothetical protein DWQ03_20365 [Calditrichota bacterium]MBL1204959.1 hypothetical protein [Calditrichota bacterium]NOG44789.1 hypothetical protein [Calditrichota bacterium]
MRKFLVTFLIVSLLSSFAFAVPNNDQVDWDLFSDNLKSSLKSENMGVKLSAMQLIIKHSENLSIDNRNAVYDVMREFRNNNNLNIRRLSLITLYKMKNDWAIDFLKRIYKFEKNEIIKSTIESIVFAYDNDDKEKVTKIVDDAYLSLAF